MSLHPSSRQLLVLSNLLLYTALNKTSIYLFGLLSRVFIYWFGLVCAGTLLVRSTAELEQVRELGPMHILSEVGVQP